ncbi:MAG: hypothetical protein IPL40_03235 [Proteobacteria bacterium]|nr:hypothetical protein [Pseudomonadota bacterium]
MKAARLVCVVLVCVVIACLAVAACDGSDRPGAPARVARIERASQLPAGACITQDQCPDPTVCVALTPRQIVCVDDPRLKKPPRGPAGQPAPPLGLLTGEALRRQVAP